MDRDQAPADLVDLVVVQGLADQAGWAAPAVGREVLAAVRGLVDRAADQAAWAAPAAVREVLAAARGLADRAAGPADQAAWVDPAAGAP